ncbi:MAG: Lrp/AsnC family transcriptional regulator [Candidatus Woesearchaeota archaeon]
MISKKDLQILAHLRQNARQTLTHMSKKTSIPISTIYDRLKLHDGDLIQKHTCLLDFNKLGFSTRAFIMLRVDRACREEIRKHLVNHLNVNTVIKINNNYDFLIEAVFRQIRELEDFLEKLEDKYKIKSKQVFYIIEDLKRESFMADPEMIQIYDI